MKIKKKICNECKKKAYLFSKGRCKPCANNEYRRKAIESRGAKKGTSGKANNYSIPKVSKSMLKKLAIYRPLRDKYMEAHQTCEYKGCNQLSNDLHHKKPRKTHLCDVNIFMAVCRNHHNYIHDNHKESVENGYLIEIVCL